MRVGVLGSLEVSVDGRPLEIGAYKQRALLGILLVERNRVVPTETIIDRLWDGHPPASAPSTFQGYLSHVRKALRAGGEDAAARVVTHPHGYMLRLAPDDVDADRFADLAAAGTRALADGDASRACELLDQALSLWRGIPFADFAVESFARDERLRLEELHAQVTEERMDAGLTLGWHKRLLPELQALVAAHPLRERLRGQLMLALYGAGRQVEALDVYRQGRVALAEELGIDPGPALQQLEESILRQDPSLDVPSGGVAAVTRLEVHQNGLPAPAVEDPFPAATSAATGVTLPEALSSIVGRQRELDELVAALTTSRLVTLTGPGGIGKTTLAVEAARRRDPAVDAAWMVELAALREPALVPNAVARALGLVLLHPDRPVVEIVGDAIGDRNALLLIDNCEHLLDGVADVAATLLTRCPRLVVLATSREPLNVMGERVYPVAPLPVAERTSEARMVDGDAMRLFETRAASLVPGFSITADNRSVVRTICRELDGLPLAIELAAARMRLLAPEQLAEHLGNRFAALAAGSRTAQPRHRTLRATVDWSFDLLSEREQHLFTTLCVFSGGFEVDAVARLWESPPVEALDALDALVSKSLVTVDTSVSPRRYGMLATLREYGRELLAAEDLQTLGVRHAEWCAELTADGESGLRGPQWRRWLRRLDTQQDNIRAAVAFALDAARPGLAAQIIAPLAWYWFRRGAIDEARRWLERCVSERGDAVGDSWSRVVMSLGAVRYLTGEPAEAQRLGDEAIAIAEDADAEFARAQATVHSAYFVAMGDLDTALRRAAAGRDLARQLRLVWLESESLTVMGNLARAAGELERAEELVLESVALAQIAQYWWQERVARWTAAKVALDRGHPDVAVERLRGIVQDLAGAGDHAGVLLALIVLAGAAAHTDAPQTGALLLGVVATYSDVIGVVPQHVDPIDAARIRDAIREMLPAEEFQLAYARGRMLAHDEVTALVDKLAAA